MPLCKAMFLTCNALCPWMAMCMLGRHTHSQGNDDYVTMKSTIVNFPPKSFSPTYPLARGPMVDRRGTWDLMGA